MEHGYGVYTLAEGKLFTGQFVNGKMHGTITYTCPNGTRYEGQFENDRENG